MSSRKLCDDCTRINCVKGCTCECHFIIGKKNDNHSKKLHFDWRKMYVLINIFCRNCNKDSRIHVKQDETKQMIEENHSCPNCNVKGKLSTVRQWLNQ